MGRVSPARTWFVSPFSPDLPQMGEPEDLAVRHVPVLHMLRTNPLPGRHRVPRQRRLALHDGLRDPRRRWLLYHLSLPWGLRTLDRRGILLLTSCLETGLSAGQCVNDSRILLLHQLTTVQDSERPVHVLTGDVGQHNNYFCLASYLIAGRGCSYRFPIW